MLIAGGKSTDYKYDKEWGTVVRLWDVRPYPSNQTVFLFFSDMVSITMAMADA